MSDAERAVTTYADAGVDRAEAGRAEDSIIKLAQATMTAGVVHNPGGFGGMFRVPAQFADGVLVSSADGVGTKLKIAMLADRHDTVGHDLVNHCVNDILVEGAQPLFFLDYIGIGKLKAGVVEALVEGMVRGCQENGCALLGGETAEMPDFYQPGEYDIAGFMVGLTKEHDRPGKSKVRAGHRLLGLASNGFHTNGYTLLRHVLFEKGKLNVTDPYPGTNRTVADELLRVHRTYLQPLLPLIRDGSVSALAHITGGGIPDNLERVIPDGLQAEVNSAAWTWPPEFVAVMALGNVPRAEMFSTFNMGIGMIVAVSPDQIETVKHALAKTETVFEIGAVVEGNEKVRMIHA